MDTELLVAAVKIIILLPLVAALAYFLIKYGLARRSFYPGGRRRMRLVEQIPIGPKTAVSLLEVGGRYILLAHSENGFHVLAEMDGLPDPVSPLETGVADWKEMLGGLRRAAGKSGARSKEPGVRSNLPE